MKIDVWQSVCINGLKSDAEFRCGFPEVELGILPAWCGTQRLPRLASLQLALDIIPTGRRMRIQEAVKNGIVDKVSCRLFKNIYHPPTKLRKGNVFSRVCPSVIPSMGGPHVTITHDALDLIVSPPTSDMGTPSPDIRSGYPFLVTSGGHHWRHVHTCSSEDPSRSNIWWWLSKHIWSAQVGGTHPTEVLSCLFSV